jgi:hypothetical protein
LILPKGSLRATAAFVGGRILALQILSASAFAPEVSA